MDSPQRGEVWFGSLDPIAGHEQGGRRPLLIASSDRFNNGRSELVVVLPITSVRKGIPSHVEINPPEGGLKVTSYIKVEDVRCISQTRLEKRVGSVNAETMRLVEQRLRWLLEL